MLLRLGEKVAERRVVRRAAFEQQAVNAMKAVNRIELRPAKAAEFQQRVPSPLLRYSPIQSSTTAHGSRTRRPSRMSRWASQR